jgi:O-antigen biosynthesis protein
MPDDPWVPVRVVDFDLLIAESSWDDGTSGGPVLVLVRVHTSPVGVVSVGLEPGQSVADHREHLTSMFRDDLDHHRSAFGCSVSLEDQPPDAPAPCLAHRGALLARAPSVSVVVATHDRPELLARCLQSLLTQTYAPLEVVVVDNARSSDATERLLKSDAYASRGVRYVREDIAGLGRAHNTGLIHSRGEVVAITDDDVIADRHWIAALLEAFVEHSAGCVTGLIVPVELRTREQSWVEQYGGFARGFRQRSISLASPPEGDPLFPFTAGRFGSGANMAFTRELLDRLNGFDAALGAGTKSRGGDDLAAFARTVLAGETLVYQPDAVVRHLHRDDYAALESMAHGYGVGLGAYLTSLFTNDPKLLGELIRRLPAGLRYLTSRDSDKNRNIRADYPRGLVLTERIGLVRGPFSYIASRWDARKMSRLAEAVASTETSPPHPAQGSP